MKKLVCFTCLTAVVSIGLLPLAAAAEPAEETRHCIVRMVPTEVSLTTNDVEEISMELQDFECFSNFSDAIHKATRGWINLPSDAQPGDLTDEILQQVPITKATTQAQYIIAIDYSGSNYSGSTLTWVTASDCWWIFGFVSPSMPSGWDNVVSSTKGFSNCDRNIIYEHTNYGGANQTCTPNCATLGAMDNQTSSRQWYD